MTSTESLSLSFSVSLSLSLCRGRCRRCALAQTTPIHIRFLVAFNCDCSFDSFLSFVLIHNDSFRLSYIMIHVGYDTLALLSSLLHELVLPSCLLAGAPLSCVLLRLGPLCLGLFRCRLVSSSSATFVLLSSPLSSSLFRLVRLSQS